MMYQLISEQVIYNP